MRGPTNGTLNEIPRHQEHRCKCVGATLKVRGRPRAGRDCDLTAILAVVEKVAQLVRNCESSHARALTVREISIDDDRRSVFLRP